jgi:hypothetical protein
MKRGFSPLGLTCALPMTWRARLQLLPVRVFELAEVGAPSAAHAGVGLGPEHRRIEVAQQGRVLRHAGDVEHRVGLAPGEDRLAGEAAVGPQDDAGLGEAFADEGDDDFKRFDGAIAGIAIAGAQLRPHRPRDAVRGPMKQ